MPDEALAHFRECRRPRRGAGSASGPSGSTRYKADHPDLHAELTPPVRAPPARGLGRRRAALSRRRRDRGHAQVVEHRPPVGGEAGARARRRLGRPRALDADADRGGRRRREAAPTAGATCTSASASTAMGAIVNGLALHYLRAYGATFLIFSDYMKGADPARRADADPVDLRLHPRLHRSGRGRPHPPAGRAARVPARDAEPQRRAAGRARTRRRWPGSSRSTPTETPTVFALSRQGLPTWNPAGVPHDAIERGAYVLRESYKDAASPT